MILSKCVYYLSLLSTLINNNRILFIVAAVDEIPILNIYYGINKKKYR